MTYKTSIITFLIIRNNYHSEFTFFFLLLLIITSINLEFQTENENKKRIYFS